MPEPRWSVAVLGPGGVGGLVGAVLARAGHPVVYVARVETAAILNGSGITVSSGRFGDFTVPARAVPRLEEPVDVCLVAVKATALERALNAVPPDVLGDGLVLPFLNGIDHLTVLRGRYAAEQVVAGAIRVESTRVATGRIEHGSPFCLIDVASATAAPERVEALAGQLKEAGLDATVRGDETVMLWEKLGLLAPLALMTTSVGAPIGVVRERHRDELVAVIQEVATAAEASGAPIDQAAILGMLDRLAPGMKSSMQRDAEAGRPLEVDAIGGAVLRAASRHGLSVPVTTNLVKRLEQ